jgi:hypothetical protein
MGCCEATNTLMMTWSIATSCDAAILLNEQKALRHLTSEALDGKGARGFSFFTFFHDKTIVAALKLLI